MSRARYSADDVANALNKSFGPSPEQKVIIEAPLECNIVIAGAGSGKTETMSNRVIQLVANGEVRVDQVLGLTFTRKAANELAKRVRDNLAVLNRSGIEIPVAPDAESIDDMFGATITTYNAFANRIYSDYAHLIGRDPDARVMSEASAWQLALEVAAGANKDNMLRVDRNLDTIAEAILTLTRAINDNMSSLDELISFGHEFIESVQNTPEGEKKRACTKAQTDDLASLIAIAESYPFMAELITEYEAKKHERGLMEFSDQVSRAHEIVMRFPQVGEAIRRQYKVVLLDEYQDTASVQTSLLSTLFRGLAVTAVGDPNQAIYGWRGASASSMDVLPFFDRYAPEQTHRPVYTLSQSWRNPAEVLRGANALIASLPVATDQPVYDLSIGSDATTGSLTAYYPETVREEAEYVAAWFSHHIASWQPRPGVGKDADLAKPTAALLVRRIADLDTFKRALDEKDVPYRVVGLGGLLTDPVIVDLVCALRVVHFANAESELIRLLAGPKWRIAPRDLRALQACAKWLAEHDHAWQKLNKDVSDKLYKSVAAEDRSSLVDALDFIAERKDRDHGALRTMSDEGFARLKEAGLLFAALRRRAGLDLREFVTVVMQALNLDIEGEANDTTASIEPVISAFMGAVSTFLSTDVEPTLGAFLRWLQDAERRDRMSPAAAEPEPGVVQLMTIHGAKGLEWHLVAVPRQVEPTPQALGRMGDTWKTFGVIPDDLRADHVDLQPWWAWRTASDRREIMENYKLYKAGAQERDLNEQRRLAYVAVTRSMQHLLVTGSYWPSGKDPRNPNSYYAELVDVTDGLEMPEPSQYSSPPEAAGLATVLWPLQPFGFPTDDNPRGAREARVRAAAELVRGATARPEGDLGRDIDLLVAEREAHAQQRRLPLPVRIPASKFKDYVENPADVATALRRPMPAEPYRATMLGTIFHAWVESLAKAEEPLSGFGSDWLSSGEERDSETGEAALGIDDISAVDEAQLAKLQQTFLSSQWGSLVPYRTELEIQLPLGPNIVICKIDAIYQHADAAGHVRYDIVDWKTGAAPKDAHDLEVRQYQLALYRLAFATWAGIPLEQVDAAFYFVAHDSVVRPERIFSEAELLERWNAIYQS